MNLPATHRIDDFIAVPTVLLRTREAACGELLGLASSGPPQGLGDQFKDGAELYAERYSAVEYFGALIERTLAHPLIASQVSQVRAIVDLGSGAGNSIFPALQKFPDASILAVDLSQPLLEILGRSIQAEADRARVTLLCADAAEDIYQPGCVDLVVGAAILHHLCDPLACLQSAAKALRPGGAAIFFEPFENGNAILALLYEQLIKENAGNEDRLDDQLLQYMQWAVGDIRFRKGRDKSSEVYQRIDDKWLFTKAFFDDAAASCGFEAVVVDPLHSVANMFWQQFQTNARLSTGRDIATPAWAQAIIEDFDQRFSDDFKRDLLIEGSIILRKSG